MKGNIRQRGKHSWQIQIYTGKGPRGRYQRHLETIKGRKSDAEATQNFLALVANILF